MLQFHFAMLILQIDFVPQQYGAQSFHTPSKSCLKFSCPSTFPSAPVPAILYDSSHTRDPIPPNQQSQYSLRKHDVIGQMRTRTEKFKSTFYLHCLSEWNVLETETRLAPSVAILKKKMLLKIRPPGKPVFGIQDPKGLSYLTQLRVDLGKLNFHKFKHNFKDTTNPMCPTNDGIEDTEHFLLLCHCFDLQRQSLLAGIYALLRPL